MIRVFQLILFICFGLTKAVKSQLPVLQWANTFDAVGLSPTFYNNGRSVATDAQGNVYTVGYFQYTVDFDPGPGVFLMTGASNSQTGLYISKLDGSGNFIWAKQIPLLLEFANIAMRVDTDGNLYITSDLMFAADFDPGPGTQILTPKGYRDIFLLKLNSNGELVWAKQFEGSGSTTGSIASTIEIDNNKNLIVCGEFINAVDLDPGSGTFYLSANGSGLFISKLDNAGNFIWAKQSGKKISGSTGVTVTDITCDINGNIFTTGTFTGNCDFDPGTAEFPLNGYQDGYVLKLDKDGNFGWVRKTGSSCNNCLVHPSGIALDAGNNVYVTGSFIGAQDFDPGNGTFTMVSLNNTQDCYALKLNQQGNFVWAKNIAGYDADIGVDVGVDIGNNMYILGNYTGTVDFDPGSGTNTIPNLYDESVITKLSADGNFIYAAPFRTIGFGSNIGRCIVIDRQFNIYCTGSGTGVTDFDPGPGVSAVAIGGHGPFTVKLAKCTNITSSTITASVCSNYTLNNIIYTQTGTYFQTIPNSTGCDSIITLNLLINRQYKQQTISICEGDSIFAGGAYQKIPGVYIDTVLTSSGCDSIISTTITVNTKPKPDLGPDRKICFNSPLIVSPGIFKSYLWNNNSVLSTMAITSKGTYWVNVTDNNNCSAIDSLVIFAADTVPTGFLPPNQLLCAGSSLFIKVPGYQKYLWSNGSVSSNVTFTETGVYILTVTDNNNCTGADTITLQRNLNCIPFSIPNAFTPNKDGLNDIFRPRLTIDVLDFSFKIYNRYGQVVFETDNPAEGWNGTFKGLAQPMNSYIYFISFKNVSSESFEYKGTLTLIR